jgi:hypothetical protein
MPTPAPSDFLRQFVLPVEDKRLQPGYRWNGSARWFRSANVVDLDARRGQDEMRRMLKLAHERWVNQWDGGRRWPP